MIYITAITILALTHLIYHRGKNGCRISMRIEKSAVLIAAIASLAAIVELVTFVTSLFVREGDEFSGWLPGILAYPAGLILFPFVVFVLLPKPILRTKQAAQEDGADNPAATVDSKSK